MSSSQKPFLHGFLNVGIFAVTLLLGSFFLNTWLPDRPRIVQEKLDYFTRHKDDYDALFLGSSAIRFQVNPVVFDHVAANGGRPTHSFNMGIDGSWGHEMNVLLQLCLSLRPGKLKYVFIDTRDWFYRLPPDVRYTDREIWWHTPRETWSVCGSVVRSDLKWTKKSELVGVHAAHCAVRSWQIGRASKRLQSAWGITAPPPEAYTDYTLIEGFTSLSPADGFGEGIYTFAGRKNGISPAGKTVDEEIREYHKRIEWIPLKAAPATYDLSADAAMVEHVRAQHAELESRQLAVIHILPPNLDDKKLFGVMHDRGHITRYWDFARPELYPELYANSNRHDFAHLNDRGATEFSRLLAERFIKDFGAEQDPR